MIRRHAVLRHAKKVSVARTLGLMAVGVIAFVAPIDVAQAISRCGAGGKVNAAGTCDCAKCFMSVGPSGAAHCAPDPKAGPGCNIKVPSCGKPGQPKCGSGGGGGPGVLPIDFAMSVSVKGGSFSAGSNAYNDYDAGPEHKVTLGDFKIDKYEVPVAEFEKCVKAKSCDAPPSDLEAIVANGTRCNYPGRKAHPMNCVTWNEASQFCTWKGKRLPTEAEWEYSAKGGAKQNVFPWGATEATCKQANFTQGVASAGCGDGTSAIGTHPLGASPFGVQDLAGNVEEWVFDYWGVFSGMNAAAPNPYNADAKEARHAIKGGSWDLSTIADMHSVRREGGDAFMRQNWLGFRCASGPVPTAAPEMFKKQEVVAPPPPPPPPQPAPNVPAPSDLGTMVKVSGGSFTMGLDGDQDAAPAHMVTVGSYSLDKYEVTVGQYKKCVDAKKCAEPLLLMSQTCNWSVPGRENHPVNCVEWSDAKSYCGFAGKRLPTEAEWEFAAKGNTNHKYPWGDTAPDCSTAAFFPRDKQQCASSTQVVGSHPKGVSFYGLFDMGGNVEEWVVDFWAPYSGGPANNPTGPTTGDVHVIRGGNWKGPEDYMRTIGRFGPKLAMDWIGFRCAKS
jgi:formylglycine-generating enzyme required for sulfatase activity